MTPEPCKNGDSTKLPEFKEIVFAPQIAIEQYYDLAYELLYKIYGVEGAWLSDESSLYDFDSEINEEGKIIHKTEEALKKIQEIYGIDISDIEDLNLVKILERIRILCNL